MNTRFKMIAATLGLVIATSAVGDVSAATMKVAATKTAAAKTAVHKTVSAKAAKPGAVKIAGRTHRVRLVRHDAMRGSGVHRLAARAKVAHKV